MLRIALALCLAPAVVRAADVSMGGSARGASPVVGVTPSFTSQLLPAVGSTRLNTLTSRINTLAGAAQLNGAGAATLGFQKQAAIPSLPDSAVTAGEAGLTVPSAWRARAQKLAAEPLAAPQSARLEPPAPLEVVPAFKRVARDLSNKTAAVAPPIELISRRGADAPTPSELHRLGEALWNLMTARGGEPDGKTGGSAARGAAATGAPAGTDSASAEPALPPAGLRSRGAAGGRGLFAGEPGGGGARNESAADHSASRWRQPLIPPDSLPGELRPEAPRGVALLSLAVVGQSLFFSEAAPAAAAASRWAACASDRAREHKYVENSAAAAAGISYNRVRRLGMLAEVGEDLDDASAAALRSSSRLLAGGARLLRHPKAAARMSEPRAPSLPGPWSWAALLPLLLAAFAAAPEFRR